MYILSAPTLCRHCVGSNCFPCFRAASSRGKTFVALRCQMRGTASLNPSHQKLEIPPKSPSVIFFSRTRKRMDGRRNERAADRPWASTIHTAHLGLILYSCSIPRHWARWWYVYICICYSLSRPSFSHQNQPTRRRTGPRPSVHTTPSGRIIAYLT